MINRRRLLVHAVTTALLLAACTGCTAASRTGSRSADPPAAGTGADSNLPRPQGSPSNLVLGDDPAAARYVTVLNRGISPSGADLGSIVQLRRLDTGAVVRTLLTLGSGAQVSAPRDRNGELVLSEVSRCTTKVFRLDGQGHPIPITTIATAASDLSLSPDGTRIAYVTHPACVPSPPCVGACSGPIEFFPNVLAVLDLGTGSTVRTSTDNPGHPLNSLSWSPDGSKLVASYSGDINQLIVFDPARPDFARALHLLPPQHCSYSGSVWTVNGIVTAQDCHGASETLSPSTLELLTPAGAPVNQWPLPNCINGIGAVTNSLGTEVLVQMGIGYGNGACGQAHLHWVTRIAALTMTGLVTSIDISQSDDVQLAAY